MKMRQHHWLSCTGALLMIVLLCAFRGQSQTRSVADDLRCQVIDENGEPIPRVEVGVQFGNGGPQTIFTDTAGRFELHAANLSQVQLSLSKPGFFRIDDRVLDLAL